MEEAKWGPYDIAATHIPNSHGKHQCPMSKHWLQAKREEEGEIREEKEEKKKRMRGRERKRGGRRERGGKEEGKEGSRPLPSQVA